MKEIEIWERILTSLVLRVRSSTFPIKYKMEEITPYQNQIRENITMKKCEIEREEERKGENAMKEKPAASWSISATWRCRVPTERYEKESKWPRKRDGLF